MALYIVKWIAHVQCSPKAILTPITLYSKDVSGMEYSGMHPPLDSVQCVVAQCLLVDTRLPRLTRKPESIVHAMLKSSQAGH